MFLQTIESICMVFYVLDVEICIHLQRYIPTWAEMKTSKIPAAKPEVLVIQFVDWTNKILRNTLCFLGPATRGCWMRRLYDVSLNKKSKMSVAKSEVFVS